MGLLHSLLSKARVGSSNLPAILDLAMFASRASPGHNMTEQHLLLKRFTIQFRIWLKRIFSLCQLSASCCWARPFFYYATLRSTHCKDWFSEECLQGDCGVGQTKQNSAGFSSLINTRDRFITSVLSQLAGVAASHNLTITWTMNILTQDWQ